MYSITYNRTGRNKTAANMLAIDIEQRQQLYSFIHRKYEQSQKKPVLFR